MGKVDTRFQTKTAQKPYQIGWGGAVHTYIGYTMENRPTPQGEKTAAVLQTFTCLHSLDLPRWDEKSERKNVDNLATNL